VRTLILLSAVLAVSQPVAGQSRWRAAISLSDARFGGTSADTSAGGDGSFRPFRPTVLGLSIERGNDGLRWGVALRYASAAAALDATQATVVARTEPLTLVELRPFASIAIASAGSARVRADAGPVLDHWRWSAGDPRTRLGAEFGASLEAPLGRRAYALIRAALTFTDSVLNAVDLPEEFERRMSVRRSVGIGLVLQP
jgi:hypothetical protein